MHSAMHQMRSRLQPSEDSFDHLRETEYCIKFSKQHIETKKQESFQNKCSLSYSLQKINREKFFGNVIPFASKAYPAAAARGKRYFQAQYSSEIAKQTRQRLFSERYQLGRTASIQLQKDEIKKYRILARKNNHQGGIDSFWMFKKDPVREEKKKPKGQGVEASEDPGVGLHSVSRTEQAFLKLLQFAKMPSEIENSLVARLTVKNYIASVFGETFTLWFINFYQIKAYINFKQFESICERFQAITLRECHMVSFFLFDDNGDGLLCPRDFFAVFERQLSPRIDQDILSVGEYVKANLERAVPVNDEYKIENVCIRDDWLTVKDYEMYFKKVDEPYLKATNKKDTVFSKSFAVLDHREKVRSKRREMNEKKNFYEELYGEITKKKNEAYIDTPEDYRLNYSELVRIFGDSPTQLYRFFACSIFGIE